MASIIASLPPPLAPMVEIIPSSALFQNSLFLPLERDRIVPLSW
ncbi:Protein CURVATURE THYLAKOID 1C, chloroplastic [Prunus dulcis]|uniref:Protein CURVATURE THYLAKOID 1C, chloroplastic n=1 Tax=Prunus dulcis TaxID=3755 RepID=A0A4Y1R4B4_PRUDU|nr:Protein CURVATURE THYLAKOID 1C, chloroplastic [Prunus dulcis]